MVFMSSIDVSFLQRISDTLVDLLKSGGEREPEILEQVFTSFSHILMHLQKYLVGDVVHVLKITIDLRFYPENYIQEFMAEALSFLLRNAPTEQLRKGIRKVLTEAAKNPSSIRKAGVSSLLWHILRGTSLKLHSKASDVLRLLMEKSIMNIGDKFDSGSDAVVEVVCSAVERLSELSPDDLCLVSKLLQDEISDCINNEYLLHLSRLISLLSIHFKQRRRSSGFKDILGIVELVIQKVIVPLVGMKAGNHSFEVVKKTLQLVLCLLDDPSTVSEVSVKCSPLFELRNHSLLTFIEVLLRKDHDILYELRFHIISAMNNLIEDSPAEVLNLMVMFAKSLQGKQLSPNVLDGVSEDKCSHIRSFIQARICYWMKLMNDIASGCDQSSRQHDESELALQWGILYCYPYYIGLQGSPSVMMEFIKALDQILTIEADKMAGIEKQTWQSLTGAALASYHKLLLYGGSGLSETSNFLRFARKFKSCSQILSSVSDFLDSVFGFPGQTEVTHKLCHSELQSDKALDAVHLFADNLSAPDKKLRIATLKLLCHYEPVNCQLQLGHHCANKKRKLEESQKCFEDTQAINVVKLLYFVESTALSVRDSRKANILISRMQMSLEAERIPEAYVPLVLNGLLGIFHIRFAHLWEPASECFRVLLGKYIHLIWDGFVRYLENIQSEVLSSHFQEDRTDSERQDNSIELVKCFREFRSPDSNCTSCTKILAMLLQSIQKIPAILESRSQQLINLFLKFLGYSTDDTFSVELYNEYSYKTKEWKLVLKEWLNLLKLIRNPKSEHRNQALKDILNNRLLGDTDPDVQQKALDCLLNWKDEYLVPYSQRLKNLIVSKNLREQLTTWTLSSDSDKIEEKHRVSLVPTVIRLLMPKVLKLKILASRKHTGVHHRRAVLSFLALLDVDELPLFFSLLLKSLQPIVCRTEGFKKKFWKSSESSMDLSQAFIRDGLENIPWKTKNAFLHVVDDIMSTFDELHIKPFLDELMTYVVFILESCSINLESQKNGETLPAGIEHIDDAVQDSGDAADPITSSTTLKHLKDMRSLCLKTISSVLNKYKSYDFGSQFWDIFFASVKPLIDSFKQEGSSSEKPSSLFSCFVVMSSSSTLISLLDRDEKLVPAIFSILTVKTASDAIIKCALTFVENLLDLVNDFEFVEDCASKRVLFAHLDTLINSLHELFLHHRVNRRLSMMGPGDREIKILKLLAKHIKDPMAAMKFVDIVVPFLMKRALSSDECLEALHVVHGLVPVLGGENSVGILNAIRPLLLSSALEIRLVICDILDHLAVNDPSLASLAKLVRELNAMSASEMGEIDYDTRVNAYEAITPELFSFCKEEHALVILSHCVYDMTSDELIFRQSASKSLLSFIEFSASILGCEATHCKAPLRDVTNDMVPATVHSFNDGISWTKAHIQVVINNFFLLHMGKAMDKGISVKRGWISLLRSMILKLPGIPALNSCQALCNEDVEMDFFENILHLQKHRRARALSRYRNVISSGKLSEKITMKVLVPLLFSMLFDENDAKSEHVKNACLESLASISCCMEWDSYHAFLLRCFRELKSRPDKQKLLMRLICSTLDKFHFSETYLIQDKEGNVHEVSNDYTTVAGKSCIVVGDNRSTSSIPPEIQATLQKTVFVKIQKLLDSDKEKVNVTTSLAALKLLKLLPSEIKESWLPNIIHRISNFLKNRLESTRDEARSALAACCKELGLEYFHFVTKVLRATLKRGYELHVLGYTLNFILSEVLSTDSVGKLDSCLDDLIAIAGNDALGDVSEEKDVERIASKMKETRKSKSLDTFKLIAQSITFKTHALKLLSPIRTHLQKLQTPKVQVKLEAILHKIAAGIECNPSVVETEFFVFVYELIEAGSTEERLHGTKSSFAGALKQSNHEKTRDSFGKFVSKELRFSPLVMVFALSMLHNRLKNFKFDKDEQLLSMLDPFFVLLADCLNSKYENIISASVKCLTSLIRLPLPSAEVHADTIKTWLLNFVHKSGYTVSPIIHSCLKLLTALVMSTKVSLSNDQLHIVLQFPCFVDIENNPSIDGLSLLKAIVVQKHVVHEIYDVVSRISRLMISTQTEPVRKKCSQILFRFLLDYRLSDKRLMQHLDFLLVNLRYVHTMGREAVLEMIHVILRKFPKSIVDSQAETFFCCLVVCLANESDSKLHSMVVTAINLLIGHTGQRTLQSLIGYSLSWYKGEKPHLWGAAAQVLGLLVEVLKKGIERHFEEILQVAQRILMSALDIDSSKEQLSSDVSVIPFWREAYHSLDMLGKIRQQFPELFWETDFEVICDLVCNFLSHPHMELRNKANHFVHSYFKSVSDAKASNQLNINLESLLLLKPSRLYRVAVSLCCQLQSQSTAVSIAAFMTQNLSFTICSLHSFAKQGKYKDQFEFLSSLSSSERDHFKKSFDLLGSQKVQKLFQSFISCDSESGLRCQSIQDIEGLQAMLVIPILKRLAKLSLLKEDIEMQVVFNCFRFVSSQIGSEGCSYYAIHMLQPLYKVCEGFSGKVINEQSKQLAEEVRDSIREILGVEKFIQEYNLLRKFIKAKRDKRRQEEKLIAVTDPTRHAKRKMRIAAKHRDHKRRKIMNMKMMRWKH